MGSVGYGTAGVTIFRDGSGVTLGAMKQKVGKFPSFVEKRWNDKSIGKSEFLFLGLLVGRKSGTPKSLDALLPQGFPNFGKTPSPFVEKYPNVSFNAARPFDNSASQVMS